MIIYADNRREKRLINLWSIIVLAPFLHARQLFRFHDPDELASSNCVRIWFMSWRAWCPYRSCERSPDVQPYMLQKITKYVQFDLNSMLGRKQRFWNLSTSNYTSPKLLNFSWVFLIFPSNVNLWWEYSRQLTCHKLFEVGSFVQRWILHASQAARFPGCSLSWQPVKRVENIGEHGSKFCVFVYCLCSIMVVSQPSEVYQRILESWRVNPTTITRRLFWREPLTPETCCQKTSMSEFVSPNITTSRKQGGVS